MKVTSQVTLFTDLRKPEVLWKTEVLRWEGGGDTKLLYANSGTNVLVKGRSLDITYD